MKALGQGGTVDGRNPANQLRLVVYLIICKVLYIPGGYVWVNVVALVELVIVCQDNLRADVVSFSSAMAAVGGALHWEQEPLGYMEI